MQRGKGPQKDGKRARTMNGRKSARVNHWHTFRPIRVCRVVVGVLLEARASYRYEIRETTSACLLKDQRRWLSNVCGTSAGKIGHWHVSVTSFLTLLPASGSPPCTLHHWHWHDPPYENSLFLFLCIFWVCRHPIMLLVPGCHNNGKKSVVSR